eukprot:m.200422 g.200422  ORF g.200422 m.200422 type:complete len:86 (+) comp15335_c1_seq3:2384-2641(+)
MGDAGNAVKGEMKMKLGDWIECDEIVREMIKHLQESREIGNGSEFIEAEFEKGLFVKKGVADLVVQRIHQWIDSNSQLVEKNKEK